jgi:hypothetical protein
VSIGVQSVLDFEPPPVDRFWEKWDARKREVLRLYGDGIPRIADDASKELGWDFTYGRPAVSEIHTEGCLRETGQMKKGRSRMAHEYEISDKGRDVLALLRAS